MANFLVAAYGGDPGGDGGMFRLGTGGMVSSRIAVRDDEYGDKVVDVGSSSTFGSAGSVGPTEGPISDEA